MGDCIFCRIAAGELPTDKVFESDEIFVFKDIQPLAPVHFLVIPKKHIPTLNDLAEADGLLISKMMQTAIELAKQQGISNSGYRLVTNCNREGGQEVFHLHLHLLGGKPLGGIATC
ncbi:MAG: histidine triad nucleotide-binding protein [Planctomycetes bacterium]|nr:histidine triad nucleotide-binding protein [Planctomycetota bacterium]